MESQRYGVSEPISTAGSRSIDQKLTEELESTLRNHRSYENKEEATIREEVRLEFC